MLNEQAASSVRFGDFELNLRSAELSTNGRKVLLQDQPFRVLKLLIEQPGELVTREEIRNTLWPNGTIVEYENAINAAVKKLRIALGDSVDEPRYIETLKRRGYRLIAQVEPLSVSQQSSRTIAADDPVSEAPGRATFQVRSPSIIVAGFAVLLAGCAVLYYHYNGRPKLTDKDDIVAADFINRTGDPVFDGTLNQGLAIELEQSPYLSVVSRERIQHLLPLMRQPAGAPITPDLARDICERTGSAAVLEGSIDRLGSHYVLGLRAKNCRNGDILDEEQTQAAKKEDVLNALSQNARNFRARVGESLSTIQKLSTPLAEATTPSLEALKQYSAAWTAFNKGGSIPALPFLRRAVEIDPEFAMAHAALGRFYRDANQPDLSEESLRRAWQLREHASDRERLFITIAYETVVTGNLTRAREAAETWVRQYPRQATPHTFISGILTKANAQYETGVEEGRKAITLDPEFAVGYYNLGADCLYLDRLNDAEKAMSAAAARGLETDELVMLAHDVAFLRNDTAGLQHAAERLSKRLDGEELVAAQDAQALAYHGRLNQARNRTRFAVDQAKSTSRERAAYWEVGSAVREALFGNVDEAKTAAFAALALSKDRDVEYAAALALSLSGDTSRTQPITEDLAARYPDDTCIRQNSLPVLRATIAMHGNRPDQALEVLQMSVPHELGYPRVAMFALFGALYPVYVRGQAFLALRRAESAALEFQKILNHRGVVGSDPIGALARLQLGRAHAMAGHTEQAREAYEDFLSLWKQADPNIPILRQAKVEYSHLIKRVGRNHSPPKP